MNAVKKLTAIVRMKRQEVVERRVEWDGAQGIDVIPADGFGEWRPHSDFGCEEAIHRLVGNVGIDALAPTEPVDSLVGEFARAAFSDGPGDGVIAVLPVERLEHIRTYREQLSVDADPKSRQERSKS